jgi:hypothetical protein
VYSKPATVHVDGVDANNLVFLIIDTKVPNAVDLDPAIDVKSTNKALFTRSEILGCKST